MKRTKLAILSSAVLLTACGTPPEPIRTTPDACAALKFITYHADPANPADTAENEIDTPETIKRIQEHNARLAAICPQKPVPPERVVTSLSDIRSVTLI